jgi:hypothetical protein
LFIPVVLYGSETWTPTLKEENALLDYENRVSTMVLGPKWQEARAEQLLGSQETSLSASTACYKDIFIRIEGLKQKQACGFILKFVVYLCIFLLCPVGYFISYIRILLFYLRD